MILVTGGTGLVGSHLLLDLTRKHTKVRAIFRPSSDVEQVRELFAVHLDNPGDQYSRIEWVPGDITDFDTLLTALDGIEYVYHVAANVSFKPGDHKRLKDNNVVGTANIVNACLEKDIKKFCFVSSTAALGSSPPGVEITENLLWTNSKNRSLYSISKFESEMEVWRGMAEGLDAVIVNPSIIIGPGDWSRSSPYLFTAVWKGMKFYTKGVTGYVGIRDVIHSMVALMESDLGGERYTVSSENLSYKEVLEMIAITLNKKPPRFYASPMVVSFVWRADWLLSSLTGKSRMLTRDAAKSSSRISMFSNTKIKEAISIEFMPVEKCIKETGGIFMETNKTKRN